MTMSNGAVLMRRNTRKRVSCPLHTLPILLITLAFSTICISQLKLLDYYKFSNYLHYADSIGAFGNLHSFDIFDSTSDNQRQLSQPKIYSNIEELPVFESSGPKKVPVHPDLDGLYEFNNVCHTKHFIEPCTQGLIYLIPNSSHSFIANNKFRCVPCSIPLDHDGGWYGHHWDEDEVKHLCGFEGTHAMFATNVSDWMECMQQGEVRDQLDLWAQFQIPSGELDSVHYFDEPVFSLKFNLNIGHSLFDQLLTYLPYWHHFRKRGRFPFRGVVSDSIEGCLSNDNGDWFCEILRAIDAFGGAYELPPKPSSTTLYCYKSLFVNHLTWQRHLKHGGLTKEIFDDFRDTLFEKFNLPRDRRRNRKDLLLDSQGTDVANNKKRLLFYAHEPSGRRVWNGMHELVRGISSLPSYRNVEFDVVYDFGVLSVAEQAKLFNEADALIMVHGAQMANSIFSVDGTLFVELGCDVPTYIGEPKYMALISGRFKMYQKCDEGYEDEACVVCDKGVEEEIFGNFTMLSKAFQQMIREVLEELEHSFA